ncbi:MULTISPECIES: methionyl-tRNA formyltransferase [Halomonadaceae]|uniref:methionyl-tRNA formyltransferase n=1 Tax=Halomonadaceae TaxID=28256 RepID=UPI001330E95C|nr:MULTISPECIES: methionyl-tRNA formyltransferase [Halomonas]
MHTNTYILASSKPWHKTQLAASKLSSGDRVLWAERPSELEQLLESNPAVRYIFFLHWNWLVPETIWKNYECVCFHMTDVPYGRGGSPLQNLIVRGHTDTMLTALRMVEEMDAGPVYAKRRFLLEGTAHEVYLRAGELSFELIRWIIKNEPQPELQKGEPVIFKRRTPEQSLLPVFGSIKSLYNHIRMLDAPTYPKAYLEHGEFILEFSGANTCEGELTATVKIRKKTKQETT